MVIIKHTRKFKMAAFGIFIPLVVIIIHNILKYNEYETVSKELYRGYILVLIDNKNITNEFREKYIEFYRNGEYKTIYEALDKTNYEIIYDKNKGKIKVYDSLE